MTTKKLSQLPHGLIGTPATISWRSSVKLGLPAYSSIDLSFAMTMDVTNVDPGLLEQAQEKLKEYVVLQTERAVKEEMEHWIEELNRPID